MDYIGLSTILNFPACETKQCVDVTIVDDEVLENVESYHVTLERTLGLDMRITLDPVEGVVEITDDGEETFSQEIVDGASDGNIAFIALPAIQLPVTHYMSKTIYYM